MTLELKLGDYWEVDPKSTYKPKSGILSTLKSIFSNNRRGNSNSAYQIAGTAPHSEKKVLSILQDFLQLNTKLSVQSTAKSILDLLPSDAPDSTEVGAFAGVCLAISGQIPYHHPAHVKLGHLVETMCRYDKLTNKPDSTGFHHRVGLLRENMVDFWSGPGEEVPGEWPNTNAFYANIEERHIFPPTSTFATWVMQDAFEKGIEKEVGYFPGMRGQYILASAQWILWSGQTLFKQIICPDDEHPEGRPSWSPGALYDGEPLFNLRRWRFWREGFEKAAEDNCLNEECRGVSRKAAAIMSSLEDGMLSDVGS